MRRQNDNKNPTADQMLSAAHGQLSPHINWLAVVQLLLALVLVMVISTARHWWQLTNQRLRLVHQQAQQ